MPKQSHQCTPSGDNTEMHSCIQTITQIQNGILRYIFLKHFPLVVAIRNGCCSLWRNGKIPLHQILYVFNQREIRGSVSQGQLLYEHHEENVESQRQYAKVRYPNEKAPHFPVEKTEVAQGQQCREQWLLYSE